MHETTVFITLGSNIEPRPNMRRAVERLRQLLSVESVSRFYESEPWGAPGTPAFLNAAVRARTALTPDRLRASLREIEAELGRVRTADANAPRTIDLDIALYGTRVVIDEEAGLRIPDPGIREHAFLAVPLADVGPEVRHPESGDTLAEIAARLASAARPHPREVPPGDQPD